MYNNKEYRCPYCQYRANDPEYIDGHLQYIGICPNPEFPTFYITPEVGGCYGARIFISPSCNGYVREFLKTMSCWRSSTKTDDNDWLGYELPIGRPEVVESIKLLLKQRFDCTEI